MKLVNSLKDLQPGVLYSTNNYSMLKLSVEENRRLHNGHIKRLVKSMKYKGWLPGSIVIVDKRGQVVSGNHRTKAAEISGVPITFMIGEVTSNTIIDLHKDFKPWSLVDIVGCYSRKGMFSYAVLESFIEKYPKIRPTECMMMVQNMSSSPSRNTLQDGLFKVGDMTKAYEWGNNIMSLEPYFPSGYNKSIFVRSMIRSFLNPKFDFKSFLHNVELRRSMLYVCGTVDQYTEMIEKIYNHMKRPEDRINLRR